MANKNNQFVTEIKYCVQQLNWSDDVTVATKPMITTIYNDFLIIYSNIKVTCFYISIYNELSQSDESLNRLVLSRTSE